VVTAAAAAAAVAAAATPSTTVTAAVSTAATATSRSATAAATSAAAATAAAAATMQVSLELKVLAEARLGDGAFDTQWRRQLLHYLDELRIEVLELHARSRRCRCREASPAGGWQASYNTCEMR
jgi:hypothetical protein